MRILVDVLVKADSGNVDFGGKENKYIIFVIIDNVETNEHF